MSEEPWTIARIIKATTDYFAQRGVDSPRLDAEVLLAATLGVNRVYLYTHHDRPLTEGERDAYRAHVKRRGGREPVAYILGQREFYGRPFVVSRDVLVPRPETEHLVDEVLAWLRARTPERARILDVGVGSGAIAVTLAAELPQAQVVGIDVSPAALAMARRNAEALGVAERVALREGDLFAPVQPGERFDAVVSNPPYIAEGERPQLSPEVCQFEPATALFAGADGLEVVRRLVSGAAGVLARPGLLAIELGAGQAEAVRALLTAAGYEGIRFAADLAGHARVALAELPGGT